MSRVVLPALEKNEQIATLSSFSGALYFMSFAYISFHTISVWVDGGWKIGLCECETCFNLIML